MNTDVLFLLKYIFTLALACAVMVGLILYFVLQMYLRNRPAVLKADFDFSAEPKIGQVSSILTGQLLRRNTRLSERVTALEARVSKYESSIEILDRALAAILIDVVKLKRKNGETEMKTDAKSCVSTDDKK